MVWTKDTQGTYAILKPDFYVLFSNDNSKMVSKVRIIWKLSYFVGYSNAIK